MEIFKPLPIQGIEFRTMLGRLVSHLPSGGGGTSILYLVKPVERSTSITCSSCYRSGLLTLVRHVVDHQGQQFYDPICDSCVPGSVRDKISALGE